MDLESLHQSHFGAAEEADDELVTDLEILEARKDIAAGILCLKKLLTWVILRNDPHWSADSANQIQFWIRQWEVVIEMARNLRQNGRYCIEMLGLKNDFYLISINPSGS